MPGPAASPARPVPGGEISRPRGDFPACFRRQPAPMHLRRVWRRSIFGLGKGDRCRLKNTPGGGEHRQRSERRSRRLQAAPCPRAVGTAGARGGSRRGAEPRVGKERPVPAAQPPGGTCAPFQMMLRGAACFVLNCYLLSK